MSGILLTVAAEATDLAGLVGIMRTRAEECLLKQRF